ncbi:MAG TPA: response regulator transcription factor, partial [Thermoleophilia bacterium]|nr:response regulator transcription factor [Thermoleophilia bacterium]
AEVVSLYLGRAGCDVRVAGDGLAALDLMLPKVDGYEVLRRIRATREVPVIMLTARKSEADRIAGLEMGADDYVVKPFSAQELVSRVRAVLRRTGQAPGGGPDTGLKYDGLTIDPTSRVVTVHGEERSLTAKEFDLLLALARRPRMVFNRDRLLELVWGSADYIDPSTVTVHVRRVRAKIEDDPSDPRFIKTVWGVGYRFEP